MNRTLVSSLALAVVSAAGSLHAQTPSGPPAAPPALPTGIGEVRGTVIAAEGEVPISGASIAVRSKSDSSLVAGAFAREGGTFLIQGLRAGTYYLRVTAIGYTPRLTDEFTIAATTPRADLGSIRLARLVIALDGVEVMAEQPTVVIEPDRNTYRAKDVAPAASTASDVLQATPSVEVDADGKVSLRGNENVAVQINGRPAPLRGTQLGAYLRQLPASVVERVEVVPTPSARHDPEGMAGIINIVLKQNTDLGLSGGLTVGASPSHRYNASGNLGYQSGPLTLFTTYGFNSDERSIVGINDRERYDALRAPLSYTEQDVAGEASLGGHNLNTSVDYRLGRRDVLSNSLVINHRQSTDATLSAYTELDSDRAVVDRYSRQRNADVRGLMFDYTTAFKRTFEPRRHELSTELRFNRADDEDRTALWRQQVDPDGASRTELESGETDARTFQLTAQLDYVRPLAERTKLETGYKGNSRWLDREYFLLKDALGTGEWVASDLSNALEFDERVHAVYGVLSQGVGKFELQAGLRGEYATREFALANPAESYPYSYGSLFPSAVAMYKPSDNTQVKLAYSRRVRRPGTQELNPFPVFFDAQNVFIGNPNLNPEYTDVVELGFTRSGKLGTVQLSPFYRRTTDIIRFIINTDDVVDGREVTSVSFENLATGNSWGTDLNGSLRLGSRFNGFGGFNIFKMVTEGGSVSSLSSNAVTWSARVNGTTQLTPALSLQAMYFYRAPMNVERGRFSKAQMTSVTMRHKLRGDKATLALRVADPFNTMGFRVEAADDNVLQITERKFDVRAVHLTFQYSFGQAPRARQPRPETQEPQAAPFSP